MLAENVFAILVTEGQLRLLADLIGPGDKPHTPGWGQVVADRLVAAAESTTGLTHPQGRAVLLPAIPGEG